MKEINASDAKNRFGQFLDWAQREPVRVTQHGRAAGILLSEEQYERLRGAAWERAGAAIDALRDEAAENELTEESLNGLLDDDS